MIVEIIFTVGLMNHVVTRTPLNDGLLTCGYLQLIRSPRSVVIRVVNQHHRITRPTWSKEFCESVVQIFIMTGSL